MGRHPGGKTRRSHTPACRSPRILRTDPLPGTETEAAGSHLPVRFAGRRIFPEDVGSRVRDLGRYWRRHHNVVLGAAVKIGSATIA